MTIGRICCRKVHTADPGESIHTAGQYMGKNGVGTLVVLDSNERPIGILTDRDLAVRGVGQGCDPDATNVSQVMTDCVHTTFEDKPVEDALALMRTEAVRRLVVVGRDGKLAGIVSLDDVLGLLAEELYEVGSLLEKESPRRATILN